mmetsp:Transcript_109643/g.214931  ORF Transcript_109643/g.214931 Transcript_109643/m.214931 type:complete len:246 (-) Transcript_109643:81-818(-)
MKAATMMGGAVAGALVGQALLPHAPPEAISYFVAGLAISAGVHTQLKMTREFRAARSRPLVPDAQQELAQRAVPIEGFTGRTNNGAHCCSQAPLDAAVAPTVLDVATATCDGGSGVCLRPFGKDLATKIGVGFFASFWASLSGSGLIFFPLVLLWQPKLPVKQLIGIASPLACCLVTFSSAGALAFGKVDVGFAFVFALVSVIFTLLGGACMERLEDSCVKLIVGIILIGIGAALGFETTKSLIE